MTAIWLWVLGKLGGVWIWVAVAGVTIAFLGGLYETGRWQGYDAGVTASLPKIAVAQHERDTAYTALADYGRKVAEDTARANAKALADKAAQEALAAQLRADLAAAQIARQQASTALQKALQNAAPKDVAPLSPAVLNYLGELRRQAASGTASAPP